MARRRAARIDLLIPAVVGVALLTTLLFSGGTSEAGQPSSIPLLAVDAEPAGNSARSVGTVEQCVSASVGQPVDVDIVIPGEGVPARRGMAAYQFSILYNATLVWISGDNGNLLLAQAAGSNVIPITDPRPDKNGIYQSWGVDFGPVGIEPLGSSETGAGTIARITLLPQAEGVSDITLSGVLVIDDQSQRIPIDSVQPGKISIGTPCAGPTQPSNPPPAAIAPSPTPSPPQPASTHASSVADAAAPPAARPVAAVPAAGGPPPPVARDRPWTAVAGIALLLAGAALVVLARNRTVCGAQSNKRLTP